MIFESPNQTKSLNPKVKPMKVVISQSMLFPWVGLLEQIRLADVFVHYDDVQFSKGSFVNRIQLKLPEGVRWMTIPLHSLCQGQSIEDVQTKPLSEWSKGHLDMLRRSFGPAPFANDAMDLVASVYGCGHVRLGDLARASMLALSTYFGIDKETRFVDVKSLNILGSSSARVLAIVKAVGGDTYVTGHGASKYLDHEIFERAGVQVEYMKYEMSPYPQLNGPFTPYVSGLDLVANCGKAGAEHIVSGTLPWRTYLDESHRTIPARDS